MSDIESLAERYDFTIEQTEKLLEIARAARTVGLDVDFQRLAGFLGQFTQKDLERFTEKGQIIKVAFK